MRTLFSAIFAASLLLAIPLRAEPTTQTAAPGSPTAAMHAYLAALDHQDAKAALDCFSTADPTEARFAKMQVDMMLAVNRLKKNARDKLNLDAAYDLQMAVVGEDECGTITEHITGDSATVEVTSADSQTNISRGPDKYLMVRLNTHWKLSTADKVKQQADSNVPLAVQTAAAQHLIAGINHVADAVAAGKLQTPDAIQEAISQSMAGSN